MVVDPFLKIFRGEVERIGTMKAGMQKYFLALGQFYRHPGTAELRLINFTSAI
jgi:hypothetical protein